MQDVYGNPLTIGDKVTYFKGGRYPSIFSATIVDVGGKVKLDSPVKLHGTGWFDGGHVDPIHCALTEGSIVKGATR